MIKDTSKQMAKVAVEALKEKKGYDVKVIDISEISILADYFIIANGSNANQVQAMVDNVEEQMYKAGFDDPKVEDYNNASWLLLALKSVSEINFWAISLKVPEQPPKRCFLRE